MVWYFWRMFEVQISRMRACDLSVWHRCFAIISAWLSAALAWSPGKRTLYFKEASDGTVLRIEGVVHRFHICRRTTSCASLPTWSSTCSYSWVGPISRIFRLTLRKLFLSWSPSSCWIWCVPNADIFQAMECCRWTVLPTVHDRWASCWHFNG